MFGLGTHRSPKNCHVQYHDTFALHFGLYHVGPSKISLRFLYLNI